MKIKMLDHYHGKLNGQVHWYKGEEHEIDDDAGAELIARGRAYEVAERKTRAAKASDKVTKAVKDKDSDG